MHRDPSHSHAHKDTGIPLLDYKHAGRLVREVVPVLLGEAVMTRYTYGPQREARRGDPDVHVSRAKRLRAILPSPKSGVT